MVEPPFLALVDPICDKVEGSLIDPVCGGNGFEALIDPCPDCGFIFLLI